MTWGEIEDTPLRLDQKNYTVFLLTFLILEFIFITFSCQILLKEIILKID